MLQVFHVDNAKVDRGVGYVAMVVHVCCKLLFSMFSCFPDICCSYLDVAYVLHIYCTCFIWMLCMFYMVFKCFLDVFASVSDAYFKCFIYLQTYVASLHLDVSKVDRVLHLAHSSPLIASPRCLHLFSVPAWHPNQRRMRAPPPSPSSRCWQRDGGRAATSGADKRSLCSMVPFGACSVTLFHDSIAKIEGILWQVLNWS
jgi:hypothetical protein